ncbi:short-chain dehydrogenase [Porphyromonas gingivicanis]|uniref:Short-chain dehydrogenase n=2 Tax=Porphyromonas gingivicanis TaxID=266762 RepID=A0A0A2G6F5_9PORP|nr:short-chain dehydrogenase [Porphyromonas gingivicanis]
MSVMKNPVALVTGATSGIGKATACKLAKMGYKVIITGRRKERLEEVAQTLRDECKIEVLPLHFDVRNNREVEEHLGNLPKEWKDIEVLVNNAGLAAGLEPIQEGLLEDWEQMIDTNIKGLLYVTRVVAPSMIARKKGHIFNIGSIAGREVYPNGNVYCATKHAVDALSKAMRIDMHKYGIKVTQVAPGAVETEFSLVRFHQDADRAENVYKGYTPLTGEDIADCIAAALNLPEHVCLADMLVLPKAQGSSRDFFKE